VVGRQDIDAGELEHALGVIERHPEAGARAPIVPGHPEALEAQLLHDLDLVLGHAPEGIVAVIRQPARLAAVAVAAQVRGDDRELLGQGGATSRQWMCVSGLPCSSSSGGPAPPTTP
jgi:hypothetical protein